MRDEEAPEDPTAKLPLFPDFSLDNRKLDALVPSCRVESWQKFSEMLNEGPNTPSDDMIYRGHRRSDWQLESTLARPFDGGAVLPKVSQGLLDKFRLAMRGRGYDLRDKEDNEVWAFGQHFGLATPMLDWTASPFVALFFAFLKDDLEHEVRNPTRAVFRINRSLVSEVLPVLFFEPTLGENARLVNQAGLFTVTPDGGENLVSAIINAITGDLGVDADDPNELAKYICKFHIPNKDRMACLNSLRWMNIHHANLFPDPMGASEYCNEWLARVVFNEKRKKAEEKAIAAREESLVSRKRSAPPGEILTSNLNVVLEVLKVFAPQGMSSAGAVNLAQKLDDRYQETFTVDWPKIESASARIRVAFRRLLLAAGFSESSREKALEALLKLYAERYWNAERSS